MENKHPQKNDDNACQPLAIIGIAFEFPQEATSIDGFWKMVCDGRSATSEFPADRFNIDAFYHPDGDRPSSIPVRGGSFLQEDLGAFDAPFFSISPNEAACMDPQHRRMLETAYHALEDASYTKTTKQIRDMPPIWTLPVLVVWLRFISHVRTCGPEVPLCRCWSFDERANGYARGEGLAVIVVKRLDDALRDNDTIRAIIRNSGSNQDGRTPGITQPSEDAQIDLITSTYRQGNIDMEPTRFFQAHATGTPVGDPIEGNAIGRAFQNYRTPDDPLYVGAVKSNIGHLEGCSGLAGIIITILVLERGLIPPIASLESLNKRIDAERLHLHFPTELIPWPTAPIRRACVNSFGFGGTNAVVILDDAHNHLRLKGRHGNHRTQQVPRSNRDVEDQNSVDRPIGCRHPACMESESACQMAETVMPTSGVTGSTAQTHDVQTSSDSLGTIGNSGTAKEPILDYTTASDSQTMTKALLVWSAPDKQGAERLNEQYVRYLSTRPSGFDLGNLAYSLAPWLSTPTKAHNNPRIVFVFTGQAANYWVLNLTSPVEFETAFTKLLTHVSRKTRRQLGKGGITDLSTITHVLEVGPHSALQGPIREILLAHTGAKPQYLASLIRQEDASLCILRLIGQLHCAGFPVDLSRANGLEERPRSMPSDMPVYPFDHSHKYWIESSLSRNLRFRGTPRHDLLGTRALDWNPQMAVWRNMMRLGELPWLEDHKIGVNAVLPAAGVLAMAIEAHQQLLGDSRCRLGVHIQNVVFSHAVSFPPGTDKIETQLTLASTSRSVDIRLWSEFRLFVLESEGYMECARGSIRAIVDAEDRLNGAASGPWNRNGNLKQWIQNVQQSCHKLVREPYRTLAGTELRYGPSFQNLDGVKVGTRGEVIARVNAETWKVRGSGWTSAPFVIHPATLDGIIQSTLQPLLAQQPNSLPTMMPVRAERIWIDRGARDMDHGFIQVAARSQFQGYRGGSVDIVATKDNPDRPLVYVEGLETAVISRTERPGGVQTDKPRRLCMKLSWKLDIEMMTAQQLLTYCTRARPKQAADAVQVYRSQIIAVMCFIEEALSYVAQNPDLKLERHLEFYVDWMRYQQRRFRGDGTESSTIQSSVKQLLKDPQARERLIYQVEHAPGDGFFFMKIGQKIVQILRGDIDPLSFIFQDGLADRYYEQMLGNDHHAYPASEFLDLQCFKNPLMNILEVGAGTGGQTMRLIETMSRGGVHKWAKYDYTDISPSFFSHAREKFRPYLDKLDFKVCDISKDPIDQGFEAGSYDLVIASHVLHATSRLQDSLRYIRKLLKANGKFLLFETTRPEAVPIGFAFGLLKGWWSPLDHEPRSPHSPCVNVEQWDALLKETGFSGVDVNIPGQEEPYCRTASIIISTAVRSVSTEVSRRTRQIYIVVNGQVETQCRAAATLQELLPKTMDATTEVCTLTYLAGAEISESSLLIMLTEVDTVLLDGIVKEDYESLQSALIKSNNILWVTRVGTLTMVQPRQHLANGLGRSLMSEDSARKFVYLELPQVERGLDHELYLICKISQRIVELPVESLENNYRVVEDKLQICRLGENAEMDKRVAQATLPRQIRESRLTRDLRVELHLSPGHIETVEWVECEIEAENEHGLESDEVKVQVQAIGLTLRDHLVGKGRLNAASLGTECAGVVIEAGSKSGYQPGDRVCLISMSTARSVVCVQVGAVFAVPPRMSLAQAASIPTAQWLAYHALINSARVQEGDVVLILQGTSCVSQMAIQLARKRGARVLVTASSASRAMFLGDTFSIPEDDIFQVGDAMIISKIYRSTNGRGVDVIIGALSDSADGLGTELSACLGPCGRLADTSLLTPAGSVSKIIGSALPSNISSSTVNMMGLMQRRPDLSHKIFQDAMRAAFDEGLRPPQPLHRFAAGDFKAAFAHFEDTEAIGKRIIVLEPETSISANIKTTPAYSFPADATYVLGGGLGGLGRSIARWMVSRGARHLILLSRSGAKSQTSRLLVSELERQGVCLATPAVDLADLGEVRGVLQRLTKRMPPVRGCIQCATVLKDNLFPKMTYDEWTIGVRSKATGSWNLHEALPSGLDFFVLLASVNGIFGGRAQANYAAANAFQDALAHYRISLGEKAVSIDLGLMVGEGIVAEDVDLLGTLRRWGQFMDVGQSELFALLDHYCNADLPLLPRDQVQVLIGVETATAIRNKGVDIHHSFLRPMFRQLFQMDRASIFKRGGEAVVDYAMALRQAPSNDAAGELVTSWFKIKIAQLLNLNEIDVDEGRPVHTYGIDSLVAIDLKNWFATEIGTVVQVFVLLGNKALGEVAREAATCSRFRR
ncbi:hypothetical protein DL769_001709 [Monosporascus sp. CRB-8-3]|nr:hypothetical protein DL769_001709 [Monosporascus sp. CRB-8-3]